MSLISFDVYKIMETNSVDEFNKVFYGIEVQKILYDIKRSSTACIKCSNYTADGIVSVAEAHNRKLLEKGQRTVSTTEGQDSAFDVLQRKKEKFM
jgi:hypothetical protein